MSVILDLKNMEDLFNETSNKIIINDMRIFDIKELVEQLFIKYENELTLIPKCKCGKLQGNYLKGEYCNACSTYVEDRFNELKPFIWVRQMRSDIPYLSPYIWTTINMLMGKENPMRWLADTTYNPPKIQSFWHTIKAIIGGRGYLNVINNLDKMLNWLKTYSKFKSPEKQLIIDTLLKKITENKDEVFSPYLPLFNNNFFIIEKNNKDRYTSSVLGDIINVATLALNTVNAPRVTDKRLEITTAKIVALVSDLFVKYVRENLSGKKKLIRKHIYGTRAHFTGRAVITAISGKHEYDELHVPWSIAVPLFRPHIINLLVKKGYNYREASDKVFAASTTFNDEIYQLLKVYITNTPEGGVPCLFHRNPSLLQGSTQKLRITKIKTDTGDNTIALSTLIVKSPNGDFDGLFKKVA